MGDGNPWWYFFVGELIGRVDKFRICDEIRTKLDIEGWSVAISKDVSVEVHNHSLSSRTNVYNTYVIDRQAKNHHLLQASFQGPCQVKAVTLIVQGTKGFFDVIVPKTVTQERLTCGGG